MTIMDAIERVDTLKPNQYTEEQKVRWLERLDGQLFLELVCTHEGAAGTLPRYGTDDTDRELLVPEPYADELYNYYLQSMIDRENGETGKYNQSGQLFNAAYLAYAGYYNRTYMPLDPGPVRF